MSHLLFRLALLWCVFAFTLSTLTAEENAYLIKHRTVQLHVIEFPPEENRGFVIFEASKPQRGSYISDVADNEWLFVTNGGFFTHSMAPEGLCRIKGQWLSKHMAQNLSGFVSIDESGKLDLYWKGLPEGKAPANLIQAGPFLIDPGGRMGIRSETGVPARRTVIGLKRNGAVLIITTSEAGLMELANILLAEIPDLERALNLDGGPSTGLAYGSVHIENRAPVLNFLAKHREASLP